MVGQVSEIAAKENFDHDSLLKAPFVGESKTVGEGADFYFKAHIILKQC